MCSYLSWVRVIIHCFPFSFKIDFLHRSFRNYAVGEDVKYRKRESVGKNLKVFLQNRRGHTTKRMQSNALDIQM